MMNEQQQHNATQGTKRSLVYNNAGLKNCRLIKMPRLGEMQVMYCVMLAIDIACLITDQKTRKYQLG